MRYNLGAKKTHLVSNVHFLALTRTLVLIWTSLIISNDAKDLVWLKFWAS
jgi:hypothetical protein